MSVVSSQANRMMKSIKIIFLFCLGIYILLVAFARADEKTMGQLDRAAQLFSKAIQADPQYGQAHYNLACALARIRIKGDICANDAYKSVILHHLNLTLKLMPSKKNKMLDDPDLESVRDTFGWQKIAGLSAEVPKDLKQILVRVQWFGPAPGAYGPVSGIDFQKNGSFRFWRLSIDENVHRQYVSGKFNLQGTRIVLNFDKPISSTKGTRFEGTLSWEGVLSIKDLDRFTDDRDECSA